MPQPSSEQNEWIARVLGATPGAFSGTEAADPVPDLSAATSAWRDALDAVDTQIGALQRVLRSSDDKDLNGIAEFGLNALTGNHKVRIQAALLEIDALRSDADSRSDVVGLIDSFLDHIASDKRIGECDSNPFGVAMSIQKTLTPPLRHLKAALTAG